MKSETYTEPSEALIAENAIIFQRFEENGVDLRQELSFEFTIEFPSKQDAEAFVDQARALMRSIEADHRLGKSDATLFCDEDEESVDVTYSVSAKAEVRLISMIEQTLGNLAADHGGSECFWEFPDPANAELSVNSVEELKR
ncbi:ribonuclease E inhibitor RraB [uncultured Ruegeria sp.]|uniref:ribonuclease E inhibitor RraB n=1 Tax=uncultured Ruegeria sp. TaxID=259304 RepID=UPI00262367EB|nr:ribonuclease E inhibitor RraB [uncultured Ruegeria sp.]